MHIDTVFTQVKRNVWVMLGVFSKKSMKHEDSTLSNGFWTVAEKRIN